MDQTAPAGTRSDQPPGPRPDTVATGGTGHTGSSAVLVVDADPDNTQIRVLDRTDHLLYTRDVGPLPDAHTHFCDVLAGIGRRFDIAAVGHRFPTLPEPRAGLLVDDKTARQLADPADQGARYITPPSYGLVLARTQFFCPHVACSDSAFYQPLPDELTGYPLPAGWQARYQVRRRGFHGLTHRYAVRRATELVGRAASRRLVSCCLGPTSSVAAVRDGTPVDATLGYAPGDALLGADCGTMDAGALLHLAADDRVPPNALRQLLEQNAGLHALTGRDRSPLDLVADADAGDPDAQRALRTQQHQLAGAVAGLTASLGGLDTLAFTGPLGARNRWMRHDLARRLRYLGVQVDPARNDAIRGDTTLSGRNAAVQVLLIEPRADLGIVAAVREVLGMGTTPTHMGVAA